MRVNISYQKIPPSKAFNFYINESIQQHHNLLGNDGHIEWIVSESKKDKISKVHYKSGQMDIHVLGIASNFHQAASKAMDHLLRIVVKKKESSKNHLHKKNYGRVDSMLHNEVSDC